MLSHLESLMDLRLVCMPKLTPLTRISKREFQVPVIMISKTVLDKRTLGLLLTLSAVEVEWILPTAK